MLHPCPYLGVSTYHTSALRVPQQPDVACETSFRQEKQSAWAGTTCVASRRPFLHPTQLRAPALHHPPSHAQYDRQFTTFYARRLL
jgi:hypothetical protein